MSLSKLFVRTVVFIVLVHGTSLSQQTLPRSPQARHTDILQSSTYSEIDWFRPSRISCRPRTASTDVLGIEICEQESRNGFILVYSCGKVSLMEYRYTSC